VGSTPAQFDEKIKAEIVKWEATIRTAGITIQ
jgi:tripartite-type tricarboxylate transporter receptor subunit TctC